MTRTYQDIPEEVVRIVDDILMDGRTASDNSYTGEAEHLFNATRLHARLITWALWFAYGKGRTDAGSELDLNASVLNTILANAQLHMGDQRHDLPPICLCESVPPGTGAFDPWESYTHIRTCPKYRPMARCDDA